MMRYSLFFFPAVMFLITQCVPNPVYHGNYSKNKKAVSQNKTAAITGSGTETGLASYYADQFHGRKTASGEIFDQKKYTAAHRTLPFGTIVLVTNQTNGKSVQVRINDRGPFVKGRIIDISLAAAKAIDLIRTGTAEVTVSVVQPDK